jgi:hypothetical protein
VQHSEVLQRIEHDIDGLGSLRKTARSYGVSPQYLSAVLSNKRGIGKKVLKALRLKRRRVVVLTYEPAGRRA